MKPIIYIDISQFYSNPARSGIQRTLRDLLCDFDDKQLSLFYIFSGDKSLYFLNHKDFQYAFEEYWDSGDQESLKLRIFNSAAPLLPHQIENGVYFLPEVTYVLNQGETRKIFESKCVTVAMVFDLFPMTHPEYFGDNGMVRPSQYFRELANFDRHICISDSTRKSLRGIHENIVHEPVVISLGTDFQKYRKAKEIYNRNDLNFIMVGTLEPRKNHLKILDFFQALNNDRRKKIRLTFIGNRGWLPSWQLKHLDQKLVEHSWFQIVSSASDQEIAELMQRASGLISVGFEGFGLPIIEARTLGCPVIFGGEQPAGNLFKGKHCIEVTGPNEKNFEIELSNAILKTTKITRRTYIDSSSEDYSKQVFKFLGLVN
jgi:glycosyltransferase involved in cell wall biosynthesis